MAGDFRSIIDVEKLKTIDVIGFYNPGLGSSIYARAVIHKQFR